MMEPVEVDHIRRQESATTDYILTGAKGRPSRMVRSLIFDVKEQEEHNWKLSRKFQRIEQNEVRYETPLLDDAEPTVVAYGTAARIAKGRNLPVFARKASRSD